LASLRKVFVYKQTQYLKINITMITIQSIYYRNTQPFRTLDHTLQSYSYGKQFRRSFTASSHNSNHFGNLSLQIRKSKCYFYNSRIYSKSHLLNNLHCLFLLLLHKLKDHLTWRPHKNAHNTVRPSIGKNRNYNCVSLSSRV
jgi:hypothetical protein